MANPIDPKTGKPRRGRPPRDEAQDDVGKPRRGRPPRDEAQDDVETELKREASGEAATETPPKRSRSRKPKAKVPRNKELEATLAQAPLILANMATTRWLGLTLVFAPESLAAVGTAFSEWLDSVDVRLTPGMALAVAYVSCISSGLMMARPTGEVEAAMQAKAEQDAAAKARAERESHTNGHAHPTADGEVVARSLSTADAA